MKLGSIERTATVVWYPGQPSFLACGTIAGAMDASFSTLTELEIFQVDAQKLPLFNKKGSIQVNAREASFRLTCRFHSLAWSTLGGPMGLLAGGKENGELEIYDPFAILSKSTESVAKQSLFNGPVKGLDFSTVNPHLLAVGGPESELWVFDLNASLSKPFRPAPKSNRIADVTTLGWNHIADYIFAAGSSHGTSSVFDLRGKREIMNLVYPGGRKPVTGMDWHPVNVIFSIFFKKSLLNW